MSRDPPSIRRGRGCRVVPPQHLLTHTPSPFPAELRPRVARKKEKEDEALRLGRGGAQPENLSTV